MKRFLQGLSTSTSSYVGKTYRVGRHECLVEDQIAEGGFSLVFLVRANSGNHYALKRISVNNRKDLAIGKQEIIIMKKLSSHKNIVTYIDSSITEVSPGIFEVLILMEYCRDGHVVQLMNDNLNIGVGEDLILRIFTDVCEAVAALHQLQPPVQHRDLKVENILRNAKGDFVLCDYGSASTTPINLKECNLSEVEDDIKRFTTLSYRAPEMVDLYCDKTINIKADIWALGCLLYKLCFFTVPFGESVLAIQNGQFSIPETSRYSKGLHNLIRYILEPDPDSRPDIYQVSQAAFQLRQMTSPVKNALNTTAPNQLADAGNALATPEKSKVSRPVREPVSTSLKPRNRPRAGGVNLAPANNPTTAQKTPVVQNTMESQSLNQQSTLLQQAHVYQQQHTDNGSQQQNYPTHPSVVHQSRRPMNNRAHNMPPAAYLNPFGQRPSREPSPVNRTIAHHVRSRSDPVPFGRDGTPFYTPSNQNETLAGRNFVPANQGQQPRHVPRPDNAPMAFPKWNPFSSDFVVNTETSDEDFASLREPHGSQQPPAVQRVQQTQNQTFPAQFVSGNLPRRYAQTSTGIALSVPGGASPNSSPYSSKSSSRRSSASDEDAIISKPQGYTEITSVSRGYRGRETDDAHMDASVNAACDVDEMTTRYERGTKLHGGPNTAAHVFDAVPFRRPAQATSSAQNVPQQVQEVDPFGAVPFSQRDAAKLARRQAKKISKNPRGQAGSEQGKRVLPIVPTQTRMPSQ